MNLPEPESDVSPEAPCGQMAGCRAMDRLGRLSLILFAVSVCVMAAVVAHLHSPQRGDLDPRAIYDVVALQFDAVRDADYLRAYGHTSNAARVRLNADEFELMARKEYAPIAKATRVEFGGVRQLRGGVQLRVYFMHRHGGTTTCLYSLVQEQGQWKIREIEFARNPAKNTRLAGLRI